SADIGAATPFRRTGARRGGYGNPPGGFRGRRAVSRLLPRLYSTAAFRSASLGAGGLSSGARNASPQLRVADLINDDGTVGERLRQPDAGFRVRICSGSWGVLESRRQPASAGTPTRTCHGRGPPLESRL